MGEDSLPLAEAALHDDVEGFGVEAEGEHVAVDRVQGAVGGLDHLAAMEDGFG